MSYVRPFLSVIFPPAWWIFTNRLFWRSWVRPQLFVSLSRNVTECGINAEGMAENNLNQTYSEILKQLRLILFYQSCSSIPLNMHHTNHRAVLVPQYSQKPQISGTHPVVRFIFFSYNCFFLFLKSLHRTWTENLLSNWLNEACMRSIVYCRKDDRNFDQSNIHFGLLFPMHVQLETIHLR